MRTSTTPTGDEEEERPFSVKETPDGSNDLKDDAKRVITTGSLVFIAYFSTCGGPFGVESGIGAGGPYALLIMALLPIFWALPQALWTAEMATLTSKNGGTIVWIQRAFGDAVGWQNAYNNLLSNIFMISIWPVMILNYITNWVAITWPYIVIHPWQIWVLKFCVVLIVTLLNLRGMQVVGFTSIILFAIIMFPFIAEFLIVLLRGQMQPLVWVDFPPPSEVNWSECLATLLWCFTGWDLLGTFAGEVKDVKTTYPRGIILALVVSFLNYSIPVTTGLSIASDWKAWGSGDDMIDFNEIASQVAPWLSKAMFLASIMNGLGQYNAILSTVSRAFWAMGVRPVNARGEEGELIAPSFIGWNLPLYDTPGVAILTLSTITICLSGLDFTFLVTLAMFLNCITINMEYAAFIKLRISEPNTPRPFKIGWGWVGMVMIGSPLIFTTGLLVTTELDIWLAAIGVHVLIFLGYRIKAFYLQSSRSRPQDEDYKAINNANEN